MFVTMGDGARLWFDVLSPEGEVTEDGVLWRPTIIGVHGGPGIDSTAMADVLAPLGDVAQVLRYDQRGHGKSDRRTAAEWTMDRWADDLAELITNLGLEEPILLGTSFGGRVALTCATRHPELVGGIVAAYGGARLDDGLTVEAFRRLGGDRAARVAAGSAGARSISPNGWPCVGPWCRARRPGRTTWLACSVYRPTRLTFTPSTWRRSSSNVLCPDCQR